MIVDGFRNGISPRKLILNRRGNTLFDTNYGIYSEAGISFYNFTRTDDFEYNQEENNEFYAIK